MTQSLGEPEGKFPLILLNPSINIKHMTRLIKVVIDKYSDLNREALIKV